MDDILATAVSDIEEAIQATKTDPNTYFSLTTLQNLQSLLRTQNPNLISEFYLQLSSNSISISSFLSPLTSTMDSAPMHLSQLSSQIYLSLLLSPNSPVFTLFTPLSFLSLLRSIRRSLKPSSAQVPPGNPSSNSGGGRKKRKGRKVSSSAADVAEDNAFDSKLFFSVLEKLGSVLDLIHLNRFPDSLKSLISTIVEILVLAGEIGHNADIYNKIIDFCTVILRNVLNSEHGEIKETSAEILKCLTPLILGFKGQSRSFALRFVKGTMMGLSENDENVKISVVNLLRFLAQKAPEKAEGRGLAVESIIEIIRSMEVDDQVGFVKYVVRMTQGKANFRLLGVDLILNLMMLLKDPFGVESGCEGEADSWGFECIEALIQRCSDLSAPIRARAISNLAQLVTFLLSNDKNCDVLRKVLGIGENAEGAGINELLRKRCMDEKANVRRAALVLVSKLIALVNGNFDGILLKTMGMACADPLVSIRKAAISALSEALRTYPNDIVIAEWLSSVPRSITDNETSIQEECENLFLELVLDRVSRAGAHGNRNSEFTSSHKKVKEINIERELELLFPEGVLVLLKEICNGEVTPWVKKICMNLGKKKKLEPKLASALQSIIRTSESVWLSHSSSGSIEKWTAPPGTWFLLSEVSAYLAKSVDWEFLYHHWQLLDKFGAARKLNSPLGRETMHDDAEGSEENSVAWAGDRVFLLQTISSVSVELPAESAADLAHNLLKRILEFNMHSTEVNAHVKALRTLCKRKALDPDEADGLVLKWSKEVLSKACRMLEKYIAVDLEADNGSNFFTPQRSQSKGKKGAAMSRLLSELVTAAYTIGSVVIVCPSIDVNTVVPILHTIITSGNSDPKFSTLPGPTVSVSLKQTAPSLYVEAWLTMGKLCLADGKLAKSYIPLFVQELEKSDCAALRNNLVVTMADFCVRYTALVDCYIPKITKCLRDPCELVRRQTFILLSRLLQMDYVKWRGVLFLRFLLSLVDESEKIRRLSDFLFVNILKVKAPLLAYNSFVESIYVLNDCKAHSGHSGSKNSRTENRLFAIRGNDEDSRSKRMHIYVSLLKQMGPEHLLATFAKLCAEILAAASDGMLNIEDITAQAVLQDAFQILGCKEIRIPSGRGSQTDTVEIEEESGDGVSAAAAKGKAITQAIRKSLIQNTIPIFIELKRLLESKNSPLIGSLMECLRILLKDYKNEIDDILVADKQLQKELIYDMQKYERSKAKTTAAEAVAAMQNTSSFASPGAPKTGNRTDALHSNSRVASAMADAAAAAKARSVLKEANKGSLTPPLSAISVPKLKSNQGTSGARSDRPLDVLESLRRRQSFDSDDEN